MKKFLIFLLHIPLAIFLVVEYFYFMWLWSGDGTFTFFGCGISYIVFMLMHILLYFRTQSKTRKKIVVYSAIILTPILSIIIIYMILAPLLGVTIQIS